jgi:small conductance mechanosensitive channel
MDVHRIFQVLGEDLVLVALRLLGAVAVFIAGRLLIGLTLRLVRRGALAQSVDPTLLRYLTSVLSVALNIVLVVGVLGYFGIETTSFAALLGAAGVAVGAAWGGLLSNFAAGAFLVLLRPFKVGDYVVAAGVEGTVRELGLFTSTVQSPDDVETIVANTRIFGDTIKNFSANPTRRVERTALVAHEVDVQDAIARLREALAKIPNVARSPAPEVWIWDFSLAGTVLAVRPHCHTNHYWQVYADTNAAIAATFGVAGYPTPAVHEVQRSLAAR